MTKLWSQTSVVVFTLMGFSLLSLLDVALEPTALSMPAQQTDPGDYWMTVDLPDLSIEQRIALCSLPEGEARRFRQQQMAEARKISDDLQDYIRSWLRGEVPPEIPEDLLPPTIDNSKTHSWTLLHPEEVKPEDQWFFYPARPEPALDGFRQLYQNSAATNVTYLRLIFMAPFDSELLVEGDFPHSREMSFHILEPLNPEFPVTTNMGVMEVPLVDVDIEPDPGHTNPFRLGANRNASNRHYHVMFELREGDAFGLNPVLQDTHFRAPGNTRVGGPLAATGPWGGGAIVPSMLWLRYYAPDLRPDGSVDPLAGVELPKALLRLNTGETFWLQSDFSLAEERQLTTSPGLRTPPVDPTALVGPSLGWFKILSILLMNAETRGYQKAQPFGPLPPAGVKANIRNQLACLFNQGADQPAPGDIGHSATDQPYNNYLVRPFWLGRGKLYVLTGRLPTTPRTRHGEPTMEPAQARYWSICHKADAPHDPVPFNSLVYGCLMDDQITTNDQNDYVIVYSRPQDKPSNARPECGVTWQDFGPQSVQSVGIRWQSVFPDHYMEAFAPTDENIPWRFGSWSQSSYDQSLVGKNEPGAMGPYHPVVHYLSKEEFEALGCPVAPDRVPKWQN